MPEELTVGQLNAAWRAVRDVHAQHLQVHDVKLPREDSFKWVWLAVLYHHRDEFVHKDDVSAHVRRVFPDAAADQQVRHLKRDGWNIESDRKGGHRLDPYNPSPAFRNDQARRRGRLAASSFDDLKKVYGSKCATCGAVEGRPDTRYGDEDVKLQQGHRDPEKPADDRDNVIPQCQFCNRSYRGDFTFDDKGRVHAVASIEPVRRASPKVKAAVRAYLDAEDSPPAASRRSRISRSGDG